MGFGKGVNHDLRPAAMDSRQIQAPAAEQEGCEQARNS